MIPADLRALDQWVAWRHETRKGKVTKVPYAPGPLAAGSVRRASSVDPSTWGSYREALSAFEADGVGFVFSDRDPYVGVDMDNCVSRNGRVHEEAARVVRRLGGYTEFSPSGLGLHVVVRGRLERGRHTLSTGWGDEFAVYSSGRFFTFTEDGGRGAPVDAQEAILELVSYYFPEPAEIPRKAPGDPSAPLCGDDAAVMDWLLADARMARLWAGETGDYGGDHSAADLALACHLAFATGRDPGRVDGLFRRSGLFRDKWDEPRGDGTYGEQTVRKACGS